MRRCRREVCRSGFGVDLETRVRVISAAWGERQRLFEQAIDQRHAEAAVPVRAPQCLVFMNPGLILPPEKDRALKQERH